MKVDIELSLGADSKHTQCCAPQPEGIACARWLLTGSKNSGQSVQLVSHGKRHTRARRWQLITREARPVLFLDCGGDFWRFAIMQCVIPTHQTLELRELAHE